MRKEKMITRTVTQTTAEAMCLDVSTAEVSCITATVGGEHDDTTLLVLLKKMYETPTFKVVHIEHKETKELLLGMTESDFIKYATVLPPRKEAK